MLLFPTPSDAFSHSQIKSKLWLVEKFLEWQSKAALPDKFQIHWLASWVGVGPFLMLSRLPTNSVSGLSLYDLNQPNLATSLLILDFWRCQNIPLQTICCEINDVNYETTGPAVFLNTSCEHMARDQWILNIPSGCFVVLQSTNMPHLEHVNRDESLLAFESKYRQYLDILQIEQIDFTYPDKTFYRYMLLGKKK